MSASPYLVALCRAHLLAEEMSDDEDMLRVLLEARAESEGIELGPLQDEQSDALRAEGALPS